MLIVITIKIRSFDCTRLKLKVNVAAADKIGHTFGML